MSEVRLIDANALIADVKSLPNDNQSYIHSCDVIDRDTVIDTIDNAPTVPEITKEKLSIAYDHGYKDGRDNWLQEEKTQGEWIPVSERLPDYMEDTLVTIQVNNREPKVRSGFYAHGCFHNDNGDTWNWNDPEVKAWMPSPKPYKEEES